MKKMKNFCGKAESKSNEVLNPHEFSPVVKRKLIKSIQSSHSYFSKRPLIDKVHHDVAAQAPKWATEISGEFFWSLDWDPEFMCRLIREGFLCIACSMGKEPFTGKTLYVILPKLHVNRMVLVPLENLHIPKNVKKRCKAYRISVNQAFYLVMAGCVKQHGENWLYKPMRDCLADMFKQPRHGVTCMSVELWNSEGKLVAGELGTTVGCCYTSLTGYFTESSTGSIQLALLGALLLTKGYKMWDIGQNLDYKKGTGAVPMPRLNFLSELHKIRFVKPREPLRQLSEKLPCKQVLDQFFSMTRPEPQPGPQGKSKKQLKREKRKLRKLEAKAKKREEALVNINSEAEGKSEPCELKSDKDNVLEDVKLPDGKLSMIV